MFIMVILRNLIDVEVKDFSNIISNRHPTYLPFSYSGNLDLDDATVDNSEWGGIASTVAVGLDLNGFMKYAEFPSEDFYVNRTAYSVEFDKKSPLYFLPQQCIKENSY
jgi:hypothetical protein